MRRILVIGAAGQIGSELVPFLRKNMEMIMLLRREEKLHSQMPLKIRVQLFI